MRILLTGRNGQVGWELERALAQLGEVFPTDAATLDLADHEAMRRAVRATRPAVIVNAAAYTAVDQAESDAASAMRINGEAPAVMAEEARRCGALLVHYSTDYVFDGSKSGPYVETDRPNPLNVYGRSKLAGEEAVRGTGCRYLILRTSWVYGARGANFLMTALRLARERPELRIVNDQFGAPTWCRALATATSAIISRTATDDSTQGIFHVTNGGRTSWLGFCMEIFRLARIATPVLPTSAADYAAPAPRPANSVLDNGKLRETFGIALPDWQTSVAECVATLESTG